MPQEAGGRSESCGADNVQICDIQTSCGPAAAGPRLALRFKSQEEFAFTVVFVVVVF